MSDDIKLTIKRAGSTVAQHIASQLDKMQASEASYYGGAAPYFRYTVFLLSVLGVREGDLLITESDSLDSVTDPKTGNPRQYRVISDPEAFPDQHMELIADRVRGT